MKIETFAEQLLFTTVRIETETESPRRRGAGTAFIFSYTQGEKQFLFLVTNKHVVQGTSVGRFFFNLRKGDEPVLGNRFDIEMDAFAQRWYGHSNSNIDVAIMPLVPILSEIEKRDKQVYFRAITHELIPDDEQMSSLDAIEEIVFIGYPNGIFDSVNLMPVVRRGTTASHPQIDYDGQPMFLIDASVFPGSSGSPVLIANTGSYSHRGGLTVGSRVLFLGIISSVAVREEAGKIDFISIPTAQIPIVRTQQMLDLGVVFKASTVRETVIEFLKEHG